MPRVLLGAVLALSACAAPLPASSPAAAQAPSRPPSPENARPSRGSALGVFPPNATQVTAKVLRQGSAAAAYLPSQPDIPDGAVLPTVTIEIQAARQARPDVAMGPAIGVIDAYSRAPVPAGIVGRRIEAVVTLVGTTRASRWLISEIRTLPE